MKIKNVTDQAFRRYGKIIEGIDFSPLLKELDYIKDTETVEYVASYQPLEDMELASVIREHCFGSMDIEIGYCVGKNNQLNALEYHRSSEINLAAKDMILLLGFQGDIDEEYHYDTKKVEAFFVPAGTAVELYASTLHFAPCGLKENDYAFKTAVVLPYGTNFAKKEDHPILNEEEKLYYARNKWLIAHPDGGQDGAFLGLVGENITLEDQYEIL
ncbi:MAG: DUF4867 family protein [Lachnospiraceae bacterium]|nr:DUF4867 family protein [Lachnospiraceae bacterium]